MKYLVHVKLVNGAYLLFTILHMSDYKPTRLSEALISLKENIAVVDLYFLSQNVLNPRS
jgi:hypothetical protein